MAVGVGGLDSSLEDCLVGGEVRVLSQDSPKVVTILAGRFPGSGAGLMIPLITLGLGTGAGAGAGVGLGVGLGVDWPEVVGGEGEGVGTETGWMGTGMPLCSCLTEAGEAGTGEWDRAGDGGRGVGMALPEIRRAGEAGGGGYVEARGAGETGAGAGWYEEATGAGDTGAGL